MTCIAGKVLYLSFYTFLGEFDQDPARCLSPPESCLFAEIHPAGPPGKLPT